MKETETLLLEYERYLKLKEIATYPQYIATVREFFTFLDHTLYYQVTAAMGDEYRAHLLSEETNLSRRTINNKLVRIRSFYLFLFKKRLLPTNPFKDLELLSPGYELPRDILSVEDMGRLLDGFGLITFNDIMLKSVVELLYGSALRISEAEILKEKDIDFTRGVITVTDLKNGGIQWKRPATEVSLRYLEKYMKNARERLLNRQELKEGYLYPRKGKTAMRGLLNHKLRKECKRQGVKDITSHTFRHSCATHMLRAGAGIREVQAMLGHEKISSTERYTHVVKEDLKNVVHHFHPRERSVLDE